MKALTASIRRRTHAIDSAYLRRLGSAANRAILVPVLMLAMPEGEARAAAVIVVNSTADTTADDGVCTLREAIVSANTDTSSGKTRGECIAGSGDDTINFSISGPPDFTNGDRKGYSIRPNSVLPSITRRVVINGFSQPGAKPNTAPNPRPLNTRILIEIDGINAKIRPGAGQSALNFQPGSDGSSIHGLAINNMGLGEVRTNVGDPSAIGAGAARLVIRGNYIGSDPTGLVDKGNLGCGICMSHAKAPGLILGGPHAADRNIIVGNDQTGASPNAGADGWVIQGNYIGLGADGRTPIGNSVPNGSGGMSIDNVADTLIGGDSLSEINVISANLSMGLAPFGATRLTVKGNRIGTDWSGTQPRPNGSSGISLVKVTDSQIGGPRGAGNLISGNNNEGIYLSGARNISIRGNTIGTDRAGVSPLPNNGNGISITNDTSGITIGGTAAADANLISGNSRAGIEIRDSTDLDIQNNRIGTNRAGLKSVPNETFGIGVGIGVSTRAANIRIGGSRPGAGNLISGNRIGNIAVGGPIATVSQTRVQGNMIGTNVHGKPDPAVTLPDALGVAVRGATDNVLIGGTVPGEGNLIGGNQVGGVMVLRLTTPTGPSERVPTRVSIVGNSIFGMAGSLAFAGQPNGQGIDLAHLVASKFPPDDTWTIYEDFGKNPRSVSGETPGEANEYLSRPVIADASVFGTRLTVRFDLAGAESAATQYRLEIFANDTNTSAEGKRYLGSVRTPAGRMLQASLTVPGPRFLLGKFLTATVSKTDGSPHNQWLGSTSEFSDAIQVRAPASETTTASGSIASTPTP